MAAANLHRSEDQVLCSICLDVFTDPVTVPCGHNFCKNCITEHWSTGDRYLCPMCKEIFTTKPGLRVNKLLSEMVGQFKDRAQQEVSSSEQPESKPGEVLCDLCTGTKLPALKSCLDCLASYCETHLEPHLTAPRLKRHQLMDPVENLEDRMCTRHDKPLELFCQTDQTCVCVLCSVLDHKNHQIVPLKEEYERKKAVLEEKEAEIQQMIRTRRVKIQEIKDSVQLSQEAADREITEAVRVFTALKESAERGQAQLIDTIQNQQETTEKQAQAVIQELEQEICQLMKTSAEVEQLSRSKDHLHLIQRVPSVGAAPPTKDWTEVNVHQPLYEGTALRAVVQLEETLREMKKKLGQAELKRVPSVGAAPPTKDWTEVNVRRPHYEGTARRAVEETLREMKKKLGQAELKRVPSVGAAPPTKDWTEVNVRRPHYEGTARRAVEETLREMKKKLGQAELKGVQQYEVDVSLDPDTANPELILSEDGKQVHHGDVWQDLPDNPVRFSVDPCVLGKQSFSSGRFYYEVQVKGKTEWDLGVARESINRKEITLLSIKEGYWSICLRNENEYKAAADPPVLLRLQPGPEKVGVFVDYEEGLVSFYDVDAAALIYSFTDCCFTEKLLPYFSPCLNDDGENAAPLIISAVIPK